MTEFQSKFTGQEVDNTINKLRNWIAVDDSYPSVTISGITYAVIWKSIPTSGTPCYGIGLHPTTGRLYEIYYDGSSYTAKAFSVDGHTHETSENNDSFNLGYYDTIVKNSDGTYTITRQTGYLVLDGVKNKFEGKFGNPNNGEYYYNGCINYISKPSSIDNIADIISNTLKASSAAILWVQNTYGIAVDTAGTIIIGLTTSISTLEDANAWLAQNPTSIQYKLATATTEKVEANHYARYNERFILEHNKSEAERSANLFSGGSLLTDKKLVVGKQYTIATKSRATYNFKIAISAYADAASGEVLYSQDGTSTFTFTWNTNKDWNLYIFNSDWVLQNNNDLEIMLNEGSTPLPYQPYEGKVMHEKDISNIGITIEDLTGN